MEPWREDPGAKDGAAAGAGTAEARRGARPQVHAQPPTELPGEAG